MSDLDRPKKVLPALARVRDQHSMQESLKKTGLEPDEMLRPQNLAQTAKKAYASTRVYHGTHSDSEPGILQKGLKPQGGPAMSDIIGDKTRSEGHVFFTNDRTRSGYYAATSAGLAQARRVQMLTQKMHATGYSDPAFNVIEDAIGDAYGHPIQPRIMRAIVAPRQKALAIADDKGDKNHDSMLAQPLLSGQMMPGHSDPDFTPTPISSAVSIFADEMRRQGMRATRSESTAMLGHQRRNSISLDSPAIDAGKSQAQAHVDKAKPTGFL